MRLLLEAELRSMKVDKRTNMVHGALVSGGVQKEIEPPINGSGRITIMVREFFPPSNQILLDFLVICLSTIFDWPNLHGRSYVS